ncbi:MAG: F0F1 ATP synthase subunit B [Candidatus Levybacteria bacterium]|nr:F0F1 ATP synthase subunit B [Candidatus Levybacteria bacterium]
MELIKNFGIDPMLLGAQVINFLIVLFLLKKLMYKPVLKLLKNRENTIKEGLAKAEEAQKLMEKTLEEEKKILKNAQNQASQLFDEAKAQGLENLRNSETYAKKQAEKILNDARAQMELDAKQTQEKLTAYISNLAVKFLQASSKEFFDKKEQEIIVEKAIKKIKGKKNL